MERLKVGILYLGLHNQLIQKYGENQTITRKDFFTKIGKHGQIPKKLRPSVLKEMEEKLLVKRINRDFIMILPYKLDLNSIKIP